MPSDISLDEERDGWVTVQSNALKATSSDFMLDSPGRRLNHTDYRRALVHNDRDGLTVNCNGDYPGGVQVDSDLTVGGAVRAGSLRLRVVDAAQDALPHTGEVGEMILVRDTRIDTVALLPDMSLWICLGTAIPSGVPGDGRDEDTVYWARVQLDRTVAGSGG